MTFHDATSLDEGVVMHKQRYKDLSDQGGDPAMKIVLPIRDKATFFVVECVGYV